VEEEFQSGKPEVRMGGQWPGHQKHGSPKIRYPLTPSCPGCGLAMRTFSGTMCGLLWIANTGAVEWAIFGAATLDGMGKAFFWPTTLGIVSGQFPKGGSLTLNAISGVGMISVRVLGASFLGTLQDVALDRNLSPAHPDAYQVVTEQPQTKFAFTFHALDAAKIERPRRPSLPSSQYCALC